MHVLRISVVVCVLVLAAAGRQPPARAETYSCAPGSTAGVATWTCAEGAVAGKPVVVTVAGTTYTHQYWDWDQDPARYSFARRMAAAGDAVVLYDRTGTGASELPPPYRVTLDLHVEVLHDLVAAAKTAGASKVVTAGHSQGSLIVMAEAARFADVDGVIITGMVHAPLNPVGAVIVAGSFGYPAQLDSRFAAVPFGYTTTVPGWRKPAFYGPTADPAVIAHDEATKSVTAPLELATAVRALSESPQIKVPVLSVIGQHDAAFCPPLIGCGNRVLPDPIDAEWLFWSSQAALQTFVLPGSGHDVNLHPNAGDWFAVASAWLDRFTG